MKKMHLLTEEMKAHDWVLERIYQKVITSDCYTHSLSTELHEDE